MRNNGPVTQQEFQLPAGRTLVSVTDLKGRIVYCNKAFVAVSGYSEAELLGQPHNLVRHPDVPAEAFRDLWATLERGHPWNAVVKNRRKNGDHYWVRANATPVRRDGRVVGYLSVRTAVTREEIAAAAALYQTMSAEADRGRLVTVLRGGRVLRKNVAGRLVQGVQSVAQWFGVAGLLNIGSAALAATSVALLPSWAWAPAVLLAAGAGFALQRRTLTAPIRQLRHDAQVLASGDLTHAVSTGLDGVAGDAAQALRQLALTLRTVISDARDDVAGLRSVAAEVANGSQEMSARTETQASSLEETAASMEEINGTVKNTAASADEGARQASEASAAAASGAEAVENLVQTMAAISESSRRIGDIIQVIEGVAFQTNILALNAAVEAARAGEQGRGFAVVASEVRSLAQRTTEAAKEIRHLIAESSQRVEAGNQVSTETHARMEALADAVRKMRDVLQEVSHAAAEQQLGVAQVAEAVQHLDTITQQNAAMVEELAASAQGVRDPIDAFDDQLTLLQLTPGQKVLAERDAVALRKEAKPAAAVGAGAAFDLQAFISAHLQWKARLRDAIRVGETFDVGQVRRDDCCPLGQWLHGSGRSTWGQRPAFTALLEQHARFHVEAARVAEVANRGNQTEVQRLLEAGGAFSQATQRTVMTLKTFDTDVRSSAQSSTPRTFASKPQKAPGTTAADGDWATF